jgi:oligopeptide transport system ATP-binding protein
MTTSTPLLLVEDLKTWFPIQSGNFFTKRHYCKAVDGVSFTIEKGKTLGLVGESGSGKTTVGRTILRLIDHTAGKVFFDGHDLFSLSSERMRSLRRRIQIIFQDPASSLNPRMTVAGIIGEPLDVNEKLSKTQHKERVAELLEKVGLSSIYMNRYSYEFSGGQRQRIGIARALASKPDLIICDEPVSALDVSIQAQILNLLSDLQKEFGLSYLFIAHNLAVVEHFADEVAVMYLGRIVEKADRDTLYKNPQHPYTQSLLSAVPSPDPSKKSTRIILPGETPSPVNPPNGCHFHPRCPYTRNQAASIDEDKRKQITDRGERFSIVGRCNEEAPQLKMMDNDDGHFHACLLR